MRHIHPVNNQMLWPAPLRRMLSLVMFIAALTHTPQKAATPQLKTTTVLDLTAKIPPSQADYQGIPGMSGGGGGGHPGPNDTARYRLPLAIRVVQASPSRGDNFEVEIEVRNVSGLPFDLPSSQDLGKIEKAGNRSKRVFFFALDSVAQPGSESQSIGSATTGGSQDVPGSFIRLAPHASLRIILPASEGLVRRALGKRTATQIQATCQEWTLDDRRFFLKGISDQLASINTIQFVLRDGELVTLQP